MQHPHPHIRPTHPPAMEGSGNATPPSAPPLLLFDGGCNLCNFTVDTMLRLDRRYAPPPGEPRLRFASLQSAAAKEVLEVHGLTPSQYIVPERPSEETVVLLEGGTAYVRSTAILRAVAQLAPAWLAALCIVLLYLVPVIVRDAIYKRVAQNRLRLFGKTDTCRMATAEEKAHFLSPKTIAMYTAPLE